MSTFHARVLEAKAAKMTRRNRGESIGNHGIWSTWPSSSVLHCRAASTGAASRAAWWPGDCRPRAGHPALNQARKDTGEQPGNVRNLP